LIFKNYPDFSEKCNDYKPIHDNTALPIITNRWIGYLPYPIGYHTHGRVGFL
jgi:hypothetical protein